MNNWEDKGVHAFPKDIRPGSECNNTTWNRLLQSSSFTIAPQGLYPILA